MKYIVKGEEPTELAAFKVSDDENWIPQYAALPGDKKRRIHSALLTEQGYICCYFIRRIDAGSSHIDHWQPQSVPPEELAIEYGNMLESCQREVDPGEPLRCGKLKENWYDPDRMVSPLEEDCEERFRFTANGDILSADGDDVAAEETIKRLGLDLPVVIASRREAIGAIVDDLDEFSSHELRTLTRNILVRREDGSFHEYCVAVAYVVRGLIPGG
ncbi:MAG: retron system putative HNH endonuclease [Planctomycetota bacterium]